MSDRKKVLSKACSYDTVRKFTDLITRIEGRQPAPEDVEALHQMLKDNPELWRVRGDLAYQTAVRIISNFTADLTSRLSLEQGWENLRQELGYHTAPPLEQMLIEQVLLCWLQLTATEHDYLDAVNQPLINGEAIILWEKRFTAAQQRYLRAIETLSHIRERTHSSSLQVNIATHGGQQLNWS